MVAPGYQVSTHRQPGSVYKLLPGRGIGMDTLGTLVPNARDLSVPAVICTPAIDREKESIIPEGVGWANYARNPVVLWEHGFCPEIPLPIAKSADNTGRLTLTKSPGRIDAVAYFTDKDPVSYQVFGLIDAGIIRATSIHVIPAPGTSRSRYELGEKITVYPQSDLLEWSFGCLGVNPESVAKVLNTGKIGGDRILGSIYKTFSPWMPRAKGNGVGADFGGVKKCAGPCTGNEKCAACSKEEDDMRSVAKTYPPQDEEEEDKDANAPPGVPPEAVAKAQTAPPGGPPAPPEAPPEEPMDYGAEEEPMEDDGMKPSQRILGAVHESLTSLAANIEGAANQYENPAAIEFLKGMVEQLNTWAQETEGLMSEVGGDVPEPDEEPADEEMVKTWLATAQGRGPRLQLTGFAGQIVRIAKSATGLKAPEAQQLHTLAKSIRAITARAIADNSYSAAQQAAAAEARLNAKLDAVAQQYATIQNTLASVMPAAR